MLIYVNFMLIYVKTKKNRTDGQTDTRTTQNYNFEPHNINFVIEFFFFIFLLKNEASNASP